MPSTIRENTDERWIAIPCEVKTRHRKCALLALSLMTK